MFTDISNNCRWDIWLCTQCIYPERNRRVISTETTASGDRSTSMVTASINWGWFYWKAETGRVERLMRRQGTKKRVSERPGGRSNGLSMIVAGHATLKRRMYALDDRDHLLRTARTRQVSTKVLEDRSNCHSTICMSIYQNPGWSRSWLTSTHNAVDGKNDQTVGQPSTWMANMRRAACLHLSISDSSKSRGRIYRIWMDF